MKKLIYLLILVLLAAGIAGCNDNNSAQIEEIEVTLYYANKEYIHTGDEKYEKLIPIKKTFEDGTDLYLNVLNELKNAPEGNDHAQELSPSDITLKSVTIKDQIAHVDISRENLHGGSTQEGFFISQIVYTLTEFEEIDKVQFLVDGEVVESLMGHYSTDKPLGRE